VRAKLLFFSGNGSVSLYLVALLAAAKDFAAHIGTEVALDYDTKVT
jgi:hypothetical protein